MKRLHEEVSFLRTVFWWWVFMKETEMVRDGCSVFGGGRKKRAGEVCSVFGVLGFLEAFI